MTLQQRIIQKNDDFGGIEKQTVDMKKLRKFTNEKKCYNNMIIYFNSLYTHVVDVESHAVDYYQTSTDTIDFLEEFNEIKNDSTNQFLINLIHFKLEFVSGIRKIS